MNVKRGLIKKRMNGAEGRDGNVMQGTERKGKRKGLEEENSVQGKIRGKNAKGRRGKLISLFVLERKVK